MKFFCGTHHPNWLWLKEPWSASMLFVSHRRLGRQKSYKPANVDWALDSGGFTELALYGRWTIEASVYVAAVRRYANEIGRMLWAAPQDWMCEPVVRAQTGLSVAEHQCRTIASVLELRALAPEIHWIPVLQGHDPEDYLEHAEQYERAGFDLQGEPLVGLGSVCRRANDDSIVSMIRRISALGIRMHGFGVKRSGVARLSHVLESADSLAWSYHARKEPPLPGCKHRNCANCPRFAAHWVAETLSSIDRVVAQQELFPLH